MTLTIINTNCETHTSFSVLLLYHLFQELISSSALYYHTLSVRNHVSHPYNNTSSKEKNV